MTNNPEPPQPLPAGSDAPGACRPSAECCSDLYELPWVHEIFEDNFHPGGEPLTRRCIESLRLPGNAHLADLGCGTGSSSLLAAEAYPVRVTGIDRSAVNVARAEQRRGEQGIESARLAFRQADAVDLPFADGELDAVMAECSFSLLTDQAAALCEIRRVLRPGGQVALTDMAREGPLPAELDEVIAPWTCLVHAHDADSYRALFESHGLEVLEFADESSGLLEMIAGLKRKLVLAGVGMAMGNHFGPGFDLKTARYWLDTVRSLVEDGQLGYLRFRLLRSA